VNFDQDTEQGRRNRTIGFTVFGLVTAGVVLGLLVGGLGLAAMRTIGAGEDGPSTASRSEPRPERSSEPPSPTPEPSPTEEETSGRPRAGAPVLRASPTAVDSFERIDLSGRFPELGGGEILQVQRRESGSWNDFADVTATTQDDGSFTTYVLTGQAGTNAFRLVSVETGEATPPVRVEVL
jgi:hypothetical protein